jgi:hypothetical protein
MAVQPIDLQTLLVRLAEVGKEQSAQRAAAAQSQAVAGSEIAQRSAEEARTVTQTHIVDEGPENVGDDEEGRGQQEGEGEAQDRHTDRYSAREDIFHDPDLGQNVDVTG